MLELLAQNPILLLFVVAAIGYPLGRIKVAGISLGVAAVLFAGLGIGSLSSGGGLALFLAGMGVTTIIAMTTLWVGYRILKIPFPLLTGLLAGLQTQPAVLGFASERAGNDLPNVGYATVYPVATVTKIVIAQLLLTLLS